MNFLKYHVSFENREIVFNFEREINALNNNNFTMGIEETLLDMAEKRGIELGLEQGMEKGLEEGKYQFVAYLLSNSEHDDEKIASITSTTVAFVKKVKGEMGR